MTRERDGNVRAKFHNWPSLGESYTGPQCLVQTTTIPQVGLSWKFIRSSR